MNNTAICEHCGGSFPIKYPRNPNRFCSYSCRSRYNIAAGITSVGFGHVDKTCPTCGVVFNVRIAEKGGKRMYCSVACGDKAKELLTGNKRYNYKGGPYPMACEICGTICMVRYSLKDRFRACSRACAAEIGRRAWPRTSRLEIAMLQAFADADLIVSPQFPIGHYTVDFAVPVFHLAIECDGIYWHSRPQQVIRDRNKDTWLRQHGWVMLRLTEAEIRTSPTDCVDRVLHCLSTLQ